MQTIHKNVIDPIMGYPIKYHEEILCVGISGKDICVWVRLNQKVPSHHRAEDGVLRIYGTGWDMGDDYREYVGTVFDGIFVWHIFREFEES